MDEQLKELLSYTKWHIGLYAGLPTILIAALTVAQPLAASEYRYCLQVTLVAFAIAGMAGGMVGSASHSTRPTTLASRKI